MKKILFLFFLFIAIKAPAQYFDWNQIILSFSNQGGWAKYSALRLAPNGEQVVRYSIAPCLMCNVETIECFADSNGNISGCHNTFWNGYRESYFDRFSNLIQVTKQGPHYSLKYYLPTDTVFIQLNDSAPDFVDADCDNNLYLFYNMGNDTKIKIIDSTGNFLNNLQLPGEQYKLNGNGDIYMCETSVVLNTAIVKRYTPSGVFIQDYPFSCFIDLSSSFPDFEISKQSGRVYGVLNNDVVCYDSLGTFINAIPILDNSHVSIALDDSENLYIWEGNLIYKYSQGIDAWHSLIDAALTEKIEVDQKGNLYYICDYSEPIYDQTNGNFIATSYSVPTSVAFKGYLSDPGPNADPVYDIVLGKISSSQVSVVNIYIAAAIQNDIPIIAFCTRSIFDVRINYDNLPVGLTEDTLYIELSDANGSFNNPVVIGIGKGLLIPCSVPDIISPGIGYQLRARLGNTISISAPFSQLYAVKTSPQTPLYLDNSIEENFSCQPFIFKTNPDQTLNYDWFSVTDPFFAPVFNFFPSHDSIIVLPVNSYEAIGVTITSNINGCAATSDYITPFELDSMNPLDLRLFMPDTVNVNDVPFRVQVPGYLQGHVSGVGIQETFPGSSVYYFYPDSSMRGLIPITRSFSHIGNPCVPYSHIQYIYVDDNLRNIVIGEIEPGDQTACVSDTISVPFVLLDSTLYDSTNVFIVELYNDDPNNNKIIKLADIGSGTVSPINCVMPNYRGEYLRLRIRSSQTGELSTFNSNGNIIVPVYPYVQFQENFFTTDCYPTNIPMNIYSSFGQHQWFRNDTLLIDSIDWNIGLTPSQGGMYLLTVRDIDNGCIVKLGPIQVNDSAHIPSLTTDPPAFYLYSCGKSFPLISAQTDTLSSISWYFGNTLINAVSDTLETSSAGLYKAVATCTAGCILSIFDPKYVYADPIVKLDNPSTTSLCNDDSVLLSVNNDYMFFAYNYEWVKNNSIIIAQTRQVFVSDSGSYNVLVSSSTGCVDTSGSIYISSSDIPVPVVAPQGIIKLYYGTGAWISTINIPGLSYQWFHNGNIINKAIHSSYFVTLPGIYTVIVGNAEKCNNTSLPVVVEHTRRYQHILPSQGRIGDDNIPVATLDIYPNPANDHFTLKGLNVEDVQLQLNIFDLYGRSIYRQNLQSSSGSINEEIALPTFADGLYRVLIESEHHSFSVPLVVAK